MRPGRAIPSPELLGDDQRRMVGQHDPTRADADGRGLRAHERQRHRGRRARNAGHRMMLGHPEAFVAEPLGVTCEVGGIAQRPAGVAAFGDGREIEHGEGEHCGEMGGTNPRCKSKHRWRRRGDGKEIATSQKSHHTHASNAWVGLGDREVGVSALLSSMGSEPAITCARPRRKTADSRRHSWKAAGITIEFPCKVPRCREFANGDKSTYDCPHLQPHLETDVSVFVV